MKYEEEFLSAFSAEFAGEEGGIVLKQAVKYLREKPRGTVELNLVFMSGTDRDTVLLEAELGDWAPVELTYAELLSFVDIQKLKSLDEIYEAQKAERKK